MSVSLYTLYTHVYTSFMLIPHSHNTHGETEKERLHVFFPLARFFFIGKHFIHNVMERKGGQNVGILNTSAGGHAHSNDQVYNEYQANLHEVKVGYLKDRQLNLGTLANSFGCSLVLSDN